MTTTLTKISHCRTLRGFSLVELMVAITLGLLITAVVIGIVISGNRNYAQDERYSRLQENARFAIKTLMVDIRNVDFWGGMIDPSTIISTLATAATCGITLNGVNNFTRDIQRNPTTFEGLNNTAASTIKETYGCIDDAKENTSVIVIKRVQGACLSGDASLRPPCADKKHELGHVYLRTNGTVGSLFEATTSTTASTGGFRDWEYIPRIYYIRRCSVTNPDTGKCYADNHPMDDGIPTLVRKNLVGDAMTSEPLVEGIENFAVTVGVPSGTTTPSETPIRVTIHLLARSLTADTAYNTDRSGSKVYNLGGSCFSIAGENPCIALKTTDKTPQNYYRRVYTSAMAVKNPGMMAQFQ